MAQVLAGAIIVRRAATALTLMIASTLMGCDGSVDSGFDAGLIAEAGAVEAGFDAGDSADTGTADAGATDLGAVDASDAGAVFDAGPARCGDGLVRGDRHPSEADYEECDGSEGCTDSCRYAVRDMVAMNGSTCMLRGDGRTFCRGYNADRTMGQGEEQTSRSIDGWRAVPGMDRLQRLRGGRDWICGLADEGPVHCWGIGTFDRGPVHPMPSPTPIAGTEGASDLDVGVYTACIVKDGGVQCWGRNLYRMLGVAQPDSSHELHPIATPGTVTQVRVSSTHACAVADGQVWCWGLASSWRFGSGAVGGQRATPVRVGTLQSVVEVAVHDAGGCARTEAGELWCWGSNWSGQGGLSASGPLAPTRVHEGEIVHAVDLFAYSGCAVVGEARQLHCFGSNVWGNAAEPTLRDLRAGSQSIAGMTDIEDMDIGPRHGCAWRRNGERFCWGANEYGQLGVAGATPSIRTEPFLVQSLEDVVQVSAGEWHFCARNRAGAVDCWGSNGWGEVGGGPGLPVMRPRRVEGLPAATDVSAGSQFSCAVGQDQRAYCWGSNLNGRLGLGDSRDRVAPTPLALNNVVQVRASSAFGCARQANGALWCWGYNGEGVLGQGDRGSHSSPQRVPNINAQEFVVGYRHVCSLSPEGFVDCWGYNANGQLGRGRVSTSEVSPVTVNVPMAYGLSSGAQHVCITTAQRGAWCWGYNGTGALGDGTTTRRPSPVPVGSLASYENLNLWKGGHGSCATSNAGERAYCWGNNYWGGVGDGSFSNRQDPVELPLRELLGGPVAGFAGSVAQTCAWGVGGRVACWGDPVAGRTGNGAANPTDMGPRPQLPFSR